MEETKDKASKPVDTTKKAPPVATEPLVETVAAVEPTPATVPVPQPVKAPTKPEVLTYRLNLHKGNGQLRSEISKGVYYEMSRRHGDIIRAISNNKFQTMDEICDDVWAAERRNFNRGHDRTRKQIEEAVADLLESGCLVSRAS